jgi:transposase-like protein
MLRLSAIHSSRYRIMNKRRRIRTIYSSEARIGAVADYLIGKMKTTAICHKWGINDSSTLSQWVRETGHFRLRKKRTLRKIEIETRYLEAA